MPYLSMSYPCHRFVRLSARVQARKKLDSAGNCIAVRVLHTTAQRSSSKTIFICHCRAPGLLLCPLPWVGTQPARAPARPLIPASVGAAGAGADSSAGSAGGGCACVWGFLEVLAVPRLSVQSLFSLPPCSAPPRNTVRKLNSMPRQHSGRSMATISLQQRSTPVTDSVRKDMSVI